VLHWNLTPLEELALRLNSRLQAKFYLEQNGVAFEEYERSDAQYRRSVEAVAKQLPRGLRSQFIDRDLLPTYQFGKRDLIMTVGPDGLVITSQMPDYGVIFRDGIEADYLAFNSGFIARIGLSERKAHLIVRS
jgi:hypothetical protein